MGYIQPFILKEQSDQVALSTQQLRSIQILGKHAFEGGLAARRIEQMCRDRKVQIGRVEYLLDELSSFSDVLTLVRLVAFEDLLSTTSSSGDHHPNLSSFSLEVRLLAATSIIYAACDKLDPTLPASILDMPLDPSIPTCVQSNPSLAEYGQFATVGVDPLSDDAGKDLCLAYHARQVLKAFGICPGMPGANLGEHLAMLIRAVYGKVLPSDPKSWEEICLPASVSVDEVPQLKGVPVARLLLTTEQDSTNAVLLEEIQALTRELAANQATQNRALQFLGWAQNEALLEKLKAVQLDAQQQTMPARVVVTYNFPLAPDTPAERHAREHLESTEAVLTTMREILGSGIISDAIKAEVAPLLVALERKPDGYNKYNRAVRYLNSLPADILQPRPAPAAAQIARNFNFSFAPGTSAERRSAEHLQNIALVIAKMRDIARSARVGAPIKLEIAKLLRPLERKPDGYHKYNEAVAYLNTLSADIV